MHFHICYRFVCLDIFVVYILLPLLLMMLLMLLLMWRYDPPKIWEIMLCLFQKMTLNSWQVLFHLYYLPIYDAISFTLLIHFQLSRHSLPFIMPLFQLNFMFNKYFPYQKCKQFSSYELSMMKTYLFCNYMWPIEFLVTTTKYDR